jgi:hypothetical protein
MRCHRPWAGTAGHTTPRGCRPARHANCCRSRGRKGAARQHHHSIVPPTIAARLSHPATNTYARDNKHCTRHERYNLFRTLECGLRTLAWIFDLEMHGMQPAARIRTSISKSTNSFILSACPRSAPPCAQWSSCCERLNAHANAAGSAGQGIWVARQQMQAPATWRMAHTLSCTSSQ